MLVRRAAIAAPLVLVLAASATWSWHRLSDPTEDPSWHESQGLQHAHKGDSPEVFSIALRHVVKALELRPVSPYSWSELAHVQYAAGVADETFMLALRMASRLGPNEPMIQDSVALYGLALWNELDVNTREAVERAVAAGMRRDAPGMVRIAERRGRLDIACRHLDVMQRNPQDWEQFCKSSEAK